MIRIAFPTLLLAAFLAPAGAAQEDGCTEDDPCEWVIDIDGEGFSDYFQDDIAFNGTFGDWFYFNVQNLDEVDHDIDIPLLAVAFTAQADDITVSEPFELADVGTFEMEDNPSGDTVRIQVFEGDVVEEEDDVIGDGDGGQGTDDANEGADDDQAEDDNGSPGLGAVALIAALGLLAIVARRAK